MFSVRSYVGCIKSICVHLSPVDSVLYPRPALFPPPWRCTHPYSTWVGLVIMNFELWTRLWLMATKSSHSQSYLPFKRVIAVQETTTSSSEGTGSSAHTIGSEVGGDYTWWFCQPPQNLAPQYAYELRSRIELPAPLGPCITAQMQRKYASGRLCCWSFVESYTRSLYCKREE